MSRVRVPFPAPKAAGPAGRSELLLFTVRKRTRTRRRRLGEKAGPFGAPEKAQGLAERAQKSRYLRVPFPAPKAAGPAGRSGLLLFTVRKRARTRRRRPTVFSLPARRSHPHRQTESEIHPRPFSVAVLLEERNLHLHLRPFSPVKKRIHTVPRDFRIFLKV